MRSLDSLLEVTRSPGGCEVVKLTTKVEESFIAVRLIRACLYSSFWEFDCSMECFRIPKSLRSGREVNKKPRKQYLCCIAAFMMCTLLLAHTSWKGLTFYKCKEQLTWTVGYYNPVPSRSASLWIFQSVSPPGLRCFQQQNPRRLLFVLYLLTIDPDAALVSSTFKITHSSSFESRWLLSVWPFAELRFFLLLHA